MFGVQFGPTMAHEWEALSIRYLTLESFGSVRLKMTASPSRFSTICLMAASLSDCRASGEDRYGISSTGQHFRHSANQFLRETKKLMVEVQKELNDFRPAGAQALRRAIRNVSLLTRSLRNAQPGGLRDAWVVGKCP